MEEKRWADPNGLANVVTSFCIFAMSPMLMGKTGATIGLIPWMLLALPIMLICIVGLFKNKDIVGAMANALLTCMALFNNFMHGVVELYCMGNGIELTEEMRTGMAYMDGGAYLAAAIFLIAVVFLAFQQNRAQAVGVALPMVAFFMLTAQNWGGFSFGLVPGCLFILFGCWQLYSGCAIMIHEAAGRPVLPYVIAPKKSGK